MLPISTLLTYPASAPIQDCFAGIVISQFNRTADQSAVDGSDFSYEDIIVKDGTGEIGVTFKNVPPLGNVKNQQIMISCANNPKRSGLKMDKAPFKGKLRVVATATAVVSLGAAAQQQAAAVPPSQFPAGGFNPGAGQPASPFPNKSPEPPVNANPFAQNKPLVSAPAPEQRQATQQPLTTIRDFLTGTEALYTECILSAYRIGQSLHTQSNGMFELEPHSIKDIGTTIYLDARKAGFRTV